MKYLIASDIHGDFESLRALYDIYHKEHFDAFIVLGDILGNAGNEFASLLKKFGTIVACKGNCDYSFDEAILGYHLLNALDFKINNYLVHIEHGHNMVKYEPQYQKYDIVFSGHTHRSEILKVGRTYFINPGSVSLPRDGKGCSYIKFIDKNIIIYTLTGKKINEVTLP